MSAPHVGWPVPGSGRLVGRTALVTGAAAGFGRAVADRFSVEGARVAYADIDGDRARAVAEAGGGRGVQMDVSDEDSVAAGFGALAADGWVPDVVVATREFSCSVAMPPWPTWISRSGTRPPRST